LTRARRDRYTTLTMHDDLGERLLQAGVITQAQLTSLQLAPNTSGGAIVRDVLRLGADEAAVYAFFERRGYGPPADAAFLATHDPTLTARIPRSTVNRLVALPISRVAGSILTAMADPSDRAAVAELAHRLDSPIRTVLARVSDLEQLFQRAYGDGTPSQPPRRSTATYERVVVREPPTNEPAQPRTTEPSRLPMPPGVVEQRRGANPSEPPIPLVRPAVSRAAEPPVAEVDANAPGTLRNLAAPTGPTSEPSLSTTAETLARPATDQVTVVSVPPVAATSAFGSGATRATQSNVRKSSRPPATTLGEVPRAVAAPTREFRPPTTQRPSVASFNTLAGGPPVPIENSLREIARASDRDAVLRAACHATATVCRSAVFLARRRDLLIGWEGAGVGISHDVVRNLWLPISGPSVFRDALSRARDYMGPPGSSAIDCVYRAVTGSRGGVTLVRPLMLRGKVIALLAVDGLSYGDQGSMRVTAVVNAVIEAFERIILANKAAGRTSEPPTSA